eukprot:gene5672-7601_t
MWKVMSLSRIRRLASVMDDTTKLQRAQALLNPLLVIDAEWVCLLRESDYHKDRCREIKEWMEK